MSTQISLNLQSANEILTRVLKTILNTTNSSCQLKSHTSQQVLLDKTFQSKQWKSKCLSISQIAFNIQIQLIRFFQRQKLNSNKYQEQLQYLEDIVRKHIKTQLQMKIIIDNVQDELYQFNKENIQLKNANSILSKNIENIQKQMKSQIKNLKIQIDHYKINNASISSKNNILSIPTVEKQDFIIEKKNDTISRIKNRLSLCDTKEFDFDLFQKKSPILRNIQDIVFRPQELKSSRSSKCDTTIDNKQQKKSLISRKTSKQSLRSSKKQKSLKKITIQKRKQIKQDQQKKYKKIQKNKKSLFKSKQQNKRQIIIKKSN